MTISTVRRLAADIFGVGQNKVRISPDGLKEAEGALTRADVSGLIGKGIITKAKPQGRASTSKGGRRGRGRRRGTAIDSKTAWMEKVRSQRAFLRMLVASGALKKESKREIYWKVKSGIFRNKRAMMLYLKDNGLVAADYEPKKPEWKRKEKAAKAPAEKKAAHAAPGVSVPKPAEKPGKEHKKGESR
ncbi:MAG: 50S ribosomal protein L19e [Candidatus Micrarchaeota archaeon]